MSRTWKKIIFWVAVVLVLYTALMLFLLLAGSSSG
jgi:hypothetical protein